jgi:hypothetical protein
MRAPPPRKDPTPKAEDNADLIGTLAGAAEVSIQTICESYNVSSLPELSEKQAKAVIKRLNLTIAKKKKEAA